VKKTLKYIKQTWLIIKVRDIYYILTGNLFSKTDKPITFDITDLNQVNNNKFFTQNMELINTLLAYTSKKDFV
jgi:hypothetical protein